MFINSIEMHRPDGRETRRARRRSSGDVKFTAPLPDGLAFTERAAAALRAYLERSGLASYRVFYNYLTDVDMADVDEYFDALGEAGAAWQPLPSPGRAGGGGACGVA